MFFLRDVFRIRQPVGQEWVTITKYGFCNTASEKILPAGDGQNVGLPQQPGVLGPAFSVSEVEDLFLQPVACCFKYLRSFPVRPPQNDEPERNAFFLQPE